MTAQSRRRLAALTRYAICIAAITWLALDTDWDQFGRAWALADWPLALMGVLAFGPAPVLIAIRLKWLLTVHDVHLTSWQIIKITFAGNFVINTLPVGTTGGDSVKAYYIARDTPYKHEAVTSVFFDRIIGVVMLILTSGVVVLANWRNPVFAGWGQGIAILVLVMFLGVCIYFSRRLRKFFRLDSLLAVMPLAGHLQRIDRAVLAFRHRLGLLAACLALSGLLQVIAIVSLFLAGRALGVASDRPLNDFLVYLGYTPICFLTGVMPIGVMEVTFRELFADTAGLGTPEAATLLSIFSRFIQLVWALPGAIVVLKGGRPKTGATNMVDESETELGTSL